MQGNYRAIKKRHAVSAWGMLVLFLCCLFCGCSQKEAKTVAVTVVDSVFYTAEQTQGRVAYGGSFSTQLTLRRGYRFVSCDYSDYEAEATERGVLLTLRNLKRPARVRAVCEKSPSPDQSTPLICTVHYDFNGGIIKESGETHRSEEYVVTQHLRPNTFNGAGLTKSGAVLIGWNTEADGSGEHVGLGSRVTVANGGELTLYAEWLASLKEEDLLTREVAPGAVALVGYRGSGDVQPFVIPCEVGGKEVAEIASSFTVNMPCGTLTAQTLVLPNTVKRVAGNSFMRSSFSELYFSDNIEEIAENAFPNNFKTYHINAYLPPCFQAVNNSVLLADNIDRLILNAEKKKLIFFSGCSTAYGLVSPAVDFEFGDEYTVFNMGMNGDINGAFQLEILLHYIKEGDVLVHAPEEMSACQLMSAFYVNNTMFVMTEGNYDLLALADFSENTGVFRAFFDYIELKKETDPCDYADGRYGDFNIYGDYICSRPYDEATEAKRDVTYSDNEYCYAPELVTDASVKKLASYYDRVREKGGKVCFSYAPVNISARENGEMEQKGDEFAAKMEGLLSVYGYTPISRVRDYMFEGRYFYDSDYHLNDLGAALRTEQLIKDLRAAGI